MLCYRGVSYNYSVLYYNEASGVQVFNPRTVKNNFFYCSLISEIVLLFEDFQTLTFFSSGASDIRL